MRADFLAVVLGSVLVGVSIAEETIPNRPPQPGEVGYRPADGSITPLNPPSFIWLHETPASTYGIQWSRHADFRDAAHADGLRWNTYTHHEPLEPGTYYWRYRYTNKGGDTSGWSTVRSVIVPSDAVAFPLPTQAEREQRIGARHPRLFMRPEDLPGLRARAAGDLAEMFRQLREEADRIILAGPTPEPTHRGSARDKEDVEAIKYWWPNRQQAEKACREAETLAFVYLITQEDKYGEAARRWVLHLASWNPDGPTNFRLNCEAAKPLLFRPARAYDWAHDRFTPAEREQIRAATLRRIQDAWESGEIAHGTGHFNRPYGSHANRVWHKVGEAGIAFLGEIPEAEIWLDYALNKFYAIYPVWCDDDGGWHEGVSYWSGYMSKAVWWLQVAQSALQIDGLKKPFFARVGDYPLYVAPPGSPNSGFGDLAYRPPSSGVGAFLDYFIRCKSQQPDGRNAAYWQWWSQQWDMDRPSGILGFLYAANLPPLPAPRAPHDLPPSKVFHGIGVASLHTTLLDSRDDVHVLFKSSPFGTQSHGHNPHNTFQLNAYGESLLTTCVYRDLHGSKFHYQWAHSTLAHNGVLVNGEGQVPHTPAPHGRIVVEQLGDELDYVVGDATDAYGGRLVRYQRHIALVKPKVTSSPAVVVIYDDLEAKEPATFQFLLHALQPFEVEEPAARLSVELPRAGVAVQYLAPARLELRQWNGYDPPPTREFPEQWHVSAGTTEKQRQLGMLTVLVPYRAGSRPTVAAERIETSDTLGARIVVDGRESMLRFPKLGTGARVQVE